MPRLEYFLVAEAISVDRETNSISLFNVVEELRPESLPYTIPKLVAVSCWKAAPEEQGQEFQVLLKVHVPGAFAPAQIPLNFTMEGERYRFNQTLLHACMDRPGAIRFELFLNSEHVADYSVTIHSPVAVA